MILSTSEMTREVMEMADLDYSVNTTQRDKIFKWCNHRYERIARSHDWAFLNKTQSLVIVEDIRDYALDSDVSRVQNIVDLVDGTVLDYLDMGEYAKFTSTKDDIVGLETEDQPQSWTILEDRTCKQCMTIADTVSIRSSSANDTSPHIIKVTGLVSGLLTSENITISGTSWVDGLLTFDSGSSLTLASTTSTGVEKSLVGYITVAETTTKTNIKTQIPPYLTAVVYRWIRINPTPITSPNALTVYYSKKLLPIKGEVDIPQFDCCKEIIQGAYADLLQNDGDARYAEAETVFVNMVNELWKAEDYRDNNSSSFQFHASAKEKQTSNNFSDLVARRRYLS